MPICFSKKYLGKFKFWRNKMQGLGLFFIGVSIFGWFGFFFAGSGHAALIAIGFLVAGMALVSKE